MSRLRQPWLSGLSLCLTMWSANPFAVGAQSCPALPLTGPTDRPTGYTTPGIYNVWPGNGTSSTARPITRIRGTVRVLAGATLVIENAELQFDDTRQRWADGGYTSANNKPSRILVENGGTLLITNSTLTTIANPDPATYCINMWDGAAAAGPDATVRVKGCRIERARTGVLAGMPAYSSAGQLVTNIFVSSNSGALITTAGSAQEPRSLFLNCHTGVSLRSPNSGRSTFEATDFRGDAPLADPAALVTLHPGRGGALRVVAHGRNRRHCRTLRPLRAARADVDAECPRNQPHPGPARLASGTVPLCGTTGRGGGTGGYTGSGVGL
jgi:hypothetical protein